MPALLEVKGLNVHYGAIHAVRGLDLTAAQGEIVAVIGSNGAGKSTTLRTLSGLLKATSGKVTFDGKDLNGVAAHDRVARGIAQVPEGRRVFATLTVEQNLIAGAHRAPARDIPVRMQAVFGRFPRLEERRHQQAGTLSGGEQQMLAIGRALMSAPRLLLLDEPSMGLAPMLVKEIFSIIKAIRQTGTTVLLVEQNARQALAIADSAHVLETGQVTISGPASAVAANQDVVSAYLGH
ncbi:MAG: ABC transporter ATP-binding protein [Bacillota bacterium]